MQAHAHKNKTFQCFLKKETYIIAIISTFSWTIIKISLSTTTEQWSGSMICMCTYMWICDNNNLRRKGNGREMSPKRRRRFGTKGLRNWQDTWSIQIAIFFLLNGWWKMNLSSNGTMRFQFQFIKPLFFFFFFPKHHSINQRPIPHLWKWTMSTTCHDIFFFVLLRKISNFVWRILK